MFRRLAYILLSTVVLFSCATAKKTAGGSKQMPLTNPTEIARSEQRARQVMDSIDRARSGASRVQADAPVEKAETQSDAAASAGNPQVNSDQLIAYARTFLGTPYKLGASGPSRFDCSGFTRYVYKHFGYELTQYSGAQYKEGRPVASYSDLQKGDLVFFGKRGSVRNIGHVGIVVSIDHYRGCFRFIHASTSGGVVESESTHPYYMMRYIGARRFLPDE